MMKPVGGHLPDRFDIEACTKSASHFNRNKCVLLILSALLLGLHVLDREDRGFLGAEVLEQHAAILEIFLGQAVAGRFGSAHGRPGGNLSIARVPRITTLRVRHLFRRQYGDAWRGHNDARNRGYDDSRDFRRLDDSRNDDALDLAGGNVEAGDLSRRNAEAGDLSRNFEAGDAGDFSRNLNTLDHGGLAHGLMSARTSSRSVAAHGRGASSC